VRGGVRSHRRLYPPPAHTRAARAAVMEDGMKALALVDAPDHVCFRYRIRAFEPALSRAGGSLAVRQIERGAFGRWLSLARLPRHDVVILQRKLLPAWHLWTLRRQARRLVFDFDDAVLFRDSYDPRGLHCRRRLRRFTATVRLADLVIAGNDFLADCALRAGARADCVRVIPTCIATDRYRPRPGDSGPRSGLELVWIGSSSTLQGIDQTRPLWERLAVEVPGLRMKLICDRATDLGAMPVVATPWSEASEAWELASADVGVTWVPDDPWSRGKCGLKVLQYMAAGLPVVANPVGVHSEMVRPGVTGFLPVSVGDWTTAVRTLADDAELRCRMGRDARLAVEREYSVAAWEGAFVAALTGSPTVPPPAFARPDGVARGARAHPTRGRPVSPAARAGGDGVKPCPDNAWRAGAS
jgi:glycosyltransferase involved in cell wall biosynthesis